MPVPFPPKNPFAADLFSEVSRLRALLAERDMKLAEREAVIALQAKTIGNLERATDALRRELLLARKRLFGSSSEKRDAKDIAEQSVFAALDAEAAQAEAAMLAEAGRPAVAPGGETAPESAPARPKKAYKPRIFPAELPREEEKVADPLPCELVCPETGEAMRPLRTETIEVLAQTRTTFRVRRLTRTVFVGPGKTAPVYSPWPADVLPRRGVDATVVAGSVTDRFADHIPYARQVDRLARMGLDLTVARLCGWAQHAADTLQPFYELLGQECLKSGYIQYDHTPVDVLDKNRPRSARAASIWAMVAPEPRLVFFRYTHDKTGKSASEGLTGYAGRLQTDGASNFGPAAEAAGVVRLACWAHARRKFSEAENGGDKDAAPWLDDIGKLFAVERHIREKDAWKNGPDNPTRLARLRARISKPVLETLFAKAHAHLAGTILHKTGLVAALRYMVNLEAPLRACFDDPTSRIDNNLVESCIRPLKIGAKNWLFIGHPDAGPTAAILYTLVANCRLVDLDPAEWLADALVNAPEARTRDEKLAWLPANYAARRAAAKAAEPKPPPPPQTN